MWLYVGLVVFRVIWSLSPQTGYIHPDEFFQTVEVIAGDVLNVTVEITWEFEGSTPIRSMAINKILFSPIFTLLHYLSSQLKMFSLTGNVILSSSRAVMTCLSFVLDYHIWKVCKMWNLDGYLGLVLLSSSYVMLTYQTHSFSNSIETIFLLCLFARIVSCNHEKFLKKVIRTEIQNAVSINSKMNNRAIKRKVVTDFKADYNLRKRKINTVENETYHERTKTETLQTEKCKDEILLKHSDTNKKKTEHFQQNNKDVAVDLSDCFFLALLNTFGIFNRPTFALFSICPFLWWCFHMRKDFVFLIRQVSQFVFFTLCFVLMMSIMDTCYYRGLAFNDVFCLKMFSQSLIVTPLNFIKYNSKTANLESHGRHPFYLHFLVNFSLLFGPLVFGVFFDIYLNLKALFKNMKTVMLSHAANFSDEMIFPKALNSHKQFLLICIIIPIILLSIFPHQEPRFLIPLLPFMVLYSLHHLKSISNIPFSFIFILFNIILSIFYGVLHQGGITRCLFQIQEMSIELENSQTYTTILFSHTYMPPKHLLLLSQQSNFSIIDLKGGNFSVLQEKLLHFKQEQSSNSKLFLVIPGTVLQDYMPKLKLISTMTVSEQYYWHLSMEDPPTVPLEDISTFMDQLSLFLVKLT